MKKKFAYLFSIAVLSVSLANCQSKPEPCGIDLSVSLTKNFVVGDRFLDYANITVKAYYTNSSSEVVPNSEVTFNLYSSSGQSYSISQSFYFSGQYNVVASWRGFRSYRYYFYVDQNHIYANSLTINGDSSIGIGNKGTIDLMVNPTNSTEEINYTQSNTDIAYLNKINKLKYEIVTVNKGTASFTFTVASSPTTFITKTFDVTVTDCYVTSLSANCPSSLGKGTTATVYVNAAPAHHNLEVYASSSNISVLKVTKVSDSEFKITGVAVGTADFKVFSLSSATTWCEVSYPVSVIDTTVLSKTTILQTYSDLNKINDRYTATPSSGNVKLLIIPIWFTNSGSFITSSKKTTVKDDIYNAFFGGIDKTGLYSVSSFYNTESNGTLNLTGVIGNWYSCGYDAQYYANNGTATRTLVKDAVNDYFTQTGASRSSFDSDSDGYLDGVVLIYAAPNYIDYKNHDTTPDQPGYGKNEDDKYYDNLWAYKTFLANTNLKSTSSPGPNNFIWASYDFMYSSSTCTEHTGVSTYYYGNTTSPRILDASTYTHEMGHMFGVPDYYDYSGIQRHAAVFSMQDGDYGSHDPYSMMALGWANPYIPTSSCVLTLNDFQSSRELILLTPEFNSFNSPFDEYLLIELYSPTGLNDFDSNTRSIGPKTVGIRLWHVDAILYRKTGSTHFTRNVYDSGTVTSTAFNNTTNIKDEGGRDCDAYYYTGDKKYQEYSILHLLRNKNTDKDYACNTKLVDADLLKAGDTFSVDAYQKQFNSFYRNYKTNQNYTETGTKLDFGQKLGWEFTIDLITNTSTNAYKAQISFTKVA